MINDETIIGDLLDIDPSLSGILLEFGMHCLGCPAAHGESLGEACLVHAVDPDELIGKLSDALNAAR